MDVLIIYYLQCTVHMDSIPFNVVAHMQFDCNGYDKWICSRILDTPLSIPPIIPAVSSAPLIFQMTGIIDAVTRRHDVFNARQSVSFWLKSPIDTASRVFWSRIPTALRTIADVAGRPLHYTNFFGIDNEAQLCKIKIGWEVELDEGVRLYCVRYNILLIFFIRRTFRVLNFLYSWTENALVLNAYWITVNLSVQHSYWPMDRHFPRRVLLWQRRCIHCPCCPDLLHVYYANDIT